MLVRTSSCRSVPALYLRAKRDAPRARTVAAILRATVSAEPTYSEPTSISRSNSARLVGPQPRSAPMRFRITW